MKKDPLTQTSINSFFSANNIKRKPEDRMDFDKNEIGHHQKSKRRKVSDDYSNVTVKNDLIDEPMDVETTNSMNTFNDGQQLKIKTEQAGYNSDYGGTDEESDNDESNTAFNAAAQEDDNEAKHSMVTVKKMQNSRNDSDTPRAKENEPETNTSQQIRIKMEPGMDQNSDNDTDTPSDDENELETQTTQPFRVKTEPGLERNSNNDCDRRHTNENVRETVTSPPIRIKTEPGLNQNSTNDANARHADENVSEIVTSPPIRIKTEPGLERNSNNDFDTRRTNENVSETVTNPPIHIKTEPGLNQNSNNCSDARDTGGNAPQTSTNQSIQIKPEPGMDQNSDNDTDTPSDDENDAYTTYGHQEQSTIHNDIDRLPMYQSHYNEEQTLFDRAEFLDEPEDVPIESDQETVNEENEMMVDQQEEINFSQPPSTNTGWDQRQFNIEQSPSGSGSSSNIEQRSKPLNVVGTKSVQSTSASKGEPMMRFNHFEETQAHDLTDDKDDEQDDHFELVDLVDEIESKFKEDMEILMNMPVNDTNQSQLIEMTRKMKKIQKNIERKQTQEHNKQKKESEERMDYERSAYIQNLYGVEYEEWFEKMNDICIIDSDDSKPSTSTAQQRASSSHASTSRASTENDKKDVKLLTWRGFLGKQKIENNPKKAERDAALDYVALDEHIKEKHKANKLNEVPEKAIKQVRDKKKAIKKKIDVVLEPYLRDGKINQKQYTIICSSCTRDCFEYDITGKFWAVNSFNYICFSFQNCTSNSNKNPLFSFVFNFRYSCDRRHH